MGNTFVGLCDDVVIYITFFMSPRDILDLRLACQDLNQLLSTCDYLWKTLLSSSNPEKWKDLTKQNISPPKEYSSWMNCFLFEYFSLVDSENKLCYRIYRNTTTVFQSSTHHIHRRIDWRGIWEYVRMLDLKDLHIKVFNFSDLPQKITFGFKSSLHTLTGFLEDPETKEILKVSLWKTKYGVRDNTSGGDEEKIPTKFEDLGNFTELEIPKNSSIDLFYHGNVAHKAIKKSFERYGGEGDVEKLDFYIVVKGCDGKSNRIPVSSGGGYDHLQGMTRGQSAMLKKELEEYFRKKRKK